MARRPYPIKDVGGVYGAPMGRRDDLPGDFEGKLHLQYVPFIDGAYDQGGAYWGTPANLWVAWGYDEDECLVEFYTRASTRDGAKSNVLEHSPDARFYR